MGVENTLKNTSQQRKVKNGTLVYWIVSKMANFKSLNLSFLLFILLSLPISTLTGFVHPGLLHTEADFIRIRQKLAANASPWVDGWKVLTSNSHAQLSYNPRPATFVSRGSGCTPDNSALVFNDVAAAYQLAVRWKISGNNSYGDKAVHILNAWAYNLTGIGCINGSSHDFLLMAGIQGYQFANAGEIMRNYSGYSPADFAQFQQMMLNVFYPINNQFPRPMTEFANWDLCAMASMLAIGVLTDNQTMFDNIVNYYLNGVNNGAVAQAVYYIHPGYLGQGQESGRDQGHATLDIAHISVIAEMAWNQGIDLYGYSNNRLLAMAEYAAKANLIDSSTGTFYTIPYEPYIYNNWPTEFIQMVFSNNSVGTLRPIFTKIYNHYVNRIGLDAPYSLKMMNLLSPDGGGGNYGGNSGGFDQLGFETLLFTRDTISQGIPPSGLTGVLQNGKVVLSWWGTAFATSYNVKRATCLNCVFVTIATVTDPLTYTDNGTSAHYYIVTANTPSGETAPSNQIKIYANNEYLNLFLKFDESSGAIASDTSGNGNIGTLIGNANFVPGRKGNAVQLDGTSGYVSLPANVIANLSDFTITTWVYVNNNVKSARLFAFGYGQCRWLMFAPAGDWKARTGNASFYITANTEGGQLGIISTAPLPTKQWVHVAFALLGDNLSYYVNGKLFANSTVPQKPYQLAQGHTLTAQNWIGRSQYARDPYFNGLVDDFRIYQGALTGSQIEFLDNFG